MGARLYYSLSGREWAILLFLSTFTHLLQIFSSACREAQKGSRTFASAAWAGSQLEIGFIAPAIQENAKLAVRGFLKQTLAERGLAVLHATDGMYNGARLEVSTAITEDGSATVDVTGTSINAPPAMTYSAIVYVLRL